MTTSRRSTRSAAAPTSWRDVEPLDVDGVRTVEVGTALWLLAFLALLPFYGRARGQRRTWWLWTCLAGFGLGLFGLEYCRRRRKERSSPRRSDDRLRMTTPTALGARRRGQPRLRRALRRSRRARAPTSTGEARLADALVAARRPDPRHRLRHGPGRGRAGALAGTTSSPPSRTRAARRSRWRRTPTWTCSPHDALALDPAELGAVRPRRSSSAT